MNINLYYRRSSANTASNIRRYVERHSHHTVRLYNETVVPLSLPDIRWGVTFGGRVAESAINSIAVIRNGQRLAFSRLMEENGIRCVKYNRGEPRDADYPIMVRTILNSSEGNGIVVCRNRSEFLPHSNYWWSKWLNFSSEFGVHVLGGQIVRKFKKLPTDVDEVEFPIRNSTRGYRFSLSTKSLPKLDSFIESVQAVYPLSFGRYDVGWISNEKEWCLIESNTAPSLSHNANTLGAYCDYFIQEFTRKENK